jgi:hypothetical protein
LQDGHGNVVEDCRAKGKRLDAPLVELRSTGAEVVTQNATTLTVAPAAGGAGPNMVYKLDGTENRMTLPESVMTSKAAWTDT